MQRQSPVDRFIICLLVFAAVYPLVTGLSYLMHHVTPTWPLWQRHLVIVPLIVLAMVFIIMPAILRLRGWFTVGQLTPADLKAETVPHPAPPEERSRCLVPLWPVSQIGGREP